MDRHPIDSAGIALLIGACLTLPPNQVRADHPSPPSYPGTALLGELNKQFDVDHNGQLDATERKAAQAGLLSRFDANGNGRLDPAEMRSVARQFKPEQAEPAAAAHAASSTEAGTSTDPRAAACLTPDALERFDRNADGRLSAAERSAARSDAALQRAVAATLLRFDADGDGRLNAAERRAARSALARLRAAPAKPSDDAEPPAPVEALADEKP